MEKYFKQAKEAGEKGTSILDLLEDEQLRRAAVRIKGLFPAGRGVSDAPETEGRIVFGLEDPAIRGRFLAGLPLPCRCMATVWM